MLAKTLATFAGVGVAGYLLVVAGLYWFQEKLIFPGGRLSSEHDFQFHVPFRELSIAVDGAELSALHFQQPDTDGVVFFLHGNGGTLVEWTENVEWWARNNYDLFIFDYRGYGKSTGSISSQTQLMEDVRTAWREMHQHYTQNPNWSEEKPVVIYGRSLGTALAAKLATEVESDMVVLVSPFISMETMLSKHYPLVPRALLRYPMRTDTVIGEIQPPLVLIHGDRDSLIPIEHSETLLAQARPTTRMLTIEGAEHGDIHQFPAYLNGLAEILPRH